MHKFPFGDVTPGPWALRVLLNSDHPGGEADDVTPENNLLAVADQGEQPLPLGEVAPGEVEERLAGGELDVACGYSLSIGPKELVR